MSIKLYRTQVFDTGSEQGKILQLDGYCLELLRSLDRIVCDRNIGRIQPDSPFSEIDDWYDDGRYWSDAYDTRWNVAVTLYYLATHPYAYDFGRLLADALDYRDNWSDWNEKKQRAVADTVFLLWKWLLQHPPGEPIGSETEISWDDSFAGRFFSFAQLMDFLDGRFLGEIFQPEPSSNRFFYACQFVHHYCENIRDQNHPWMKHLPSQKEIQKFLQCGFFTFPEHEDIASAAETTIAWNAGTCQLLDGYTGLTSGRRS